jgi:hypothetical protein
MTDDDNHVSSLLSLLGYMHLNTYVNDLREGNVKTTSLPDAFLPPLLVSFLLPLKGFLPFHFHHLIQPLLLCIQFFLYLLLLQDLGIPDGVALGIEDNLGSGGKMSH